MVCLSPSLAGCIRSIIENTRKRAFRAVLANYSSQNLEECRRHQDFTIAVEEEGVSGTRACFVVLALIPLMPGGDEDAIIRG